MFFTSANDVLDLEIPAAGTQYQANSESVAAFASLLHADQWMIFRNTFTDVLHWDYVRFSLLTLDLIF